MIKISFSDFNLDFEELSNDVEAHLNSIHVRYEACDVKEWAGNFIYYVATFTIDSKSKVLFNQLDKKYYNTPVLVEFE